jgi:hypothetical protein
MSSRGDRFRAVIEGALELWQVRARARFDAAQPRCRIVDDAGREIVVSLEDGAAGEHWRIECPGRTPRVHRSVVPALATLRAAVAPGRSRGRALFVPMAPGQGPDS